MILVFYPIHLPALSLLSVDWIWLGSSSLTPWGLEGGGLRITHIREYRALLLFSSASFLHNQCTCCVNSQEEIKITKAQRSEAKHALLETGPGGKSFHHLLSLLLFVLLHENILQSSIDSHWLKSHQCPLIDVNDCAWVPRLWLTVVTYFHTSVQYIKYAASARPFISCSKMLHCRFLFSSYYPSVRHLIVIMSWYALPPPLFLF